MSYNDGYNNSGNGGGRHGAADDYYSGNGQNDSYDNRGGNNYSSGGGNSGYDNRGSGGNEGRYNDTRYDDNSQSRYSSQNDNYNGALSHAQQHDSGDNSSLFSQALSFLNQNKDRISNSNINEEQAVKAHQSLYGGGSGGNTQHDSQTLGAGAAMQALKMFTSQGSSGGSGVSAGGDKNQLIGLAMAQASKLWDQQGGSAVCSFALNPLREVQFTNYRPSSPATSNLPSTPPRRWP